MRFKNIGASREELIILYTLKIQSIIMFGSICFHSALSLEPSDKLELQQKRSLVVILGSHYRSYRSALSLTFLPRLDTLRQEACLKWALKAQKNPIQLELFTLAQKNIANRSKGRFSEYKCKTHRFYKR